MDFDFSPNFNAFSRLSFDSDTNRKHCKQKVTGKQRQAANERERKRMNSINQGFNSLRGRLPTASLDKKLSKVDTLRQAMKYIQHLKSMLEENENNRNNNVPNTNQQKIFVESNQSENPPSIYMISWKKNSDEFGAIHESSRGPVGFQKDVWCPTDNITAKTEPNF